MSHIKFACPYCSQSLEAPSDMAGETLSCPACQKQITVPRPTRPPATIQRPHPSHIAQPKPQLKTFTPAQPPPRPKSPVRWAVAALVFILIAYVAWPYISVWRLYSALRSEDADAISARIDFSSLRASMKDQMNAFFMKEMVNDKEMADNPFAALAVAFLPKMVESIVDAYVTPAGVTQMFETGAFKSGKKAAEKQTPAPAQARLKDVKSAFFSDPTKFLLKTEDVDFVFRLRDWTWKLAEVKLTQSALRSMGPERGLSEDREVDDKPVGWQLRTDVSPIDDSKSYFLSREATEPVGSGFMSSTPTLMVRYKERELEVYVTFGTYLGSDSTPVTVRMGTSPASQEEWGLSTDGKAIFCPTDDSAFVDQLLQNDRLVIRLTPFGESPVTATFDLTGLAEASKPMKAAIQR